MAGSQKDSETQYVLKKGGNEVQIVACTGWSEPCEYCDKRFCAWVPVDEDVYEKIPDKPGFCIIGLKNKNTTEVVSILFDQNNIQNQATIELDKIKEQISNKKSKATKSIMLVRWVVIKKIEDKDNSILCAHWQNYGLLPKFLKAWPGNTLLEESDAVELSKQTQKWCYPQKNPVWRKPKPVPSKILEEVTKCNPQDCKTCDSYFTPWKSLTDVIEKDSAAEGKGLVMLSVVCGKKREIERISYDERDLTVPIKSAVKYYDSSENYVLKKYVNKNPKLEVRWALINDVNCDNSCFLYAHWLNADKYPEQNTALPGEKFLNSNKHFVYRTNDQKWFYEIEAFKQTKFSKTKNRRRVLEEMADQDYDSDED